MPPSDTKTPKRLLAGLQRKPTDVVGLDVASSGIKVVRMKKTDTEIVLVAADVLSPSSLPRISPEGNIEAVPLRLRAELAGKYASLAVSGVNSVVKLLSFPGHGTQIDEATEAKIVESVGVENPDQFRIGYKVVSEGRSELRVIVVALPNTEARAACMLLPSGLPAPYSLEVSGLAAMTAFMHGPARASQDDAVGMVEFGARVSYFAIFKKALPLLFRKFDLGGDLILAKVQESLGIDRITAEGILADGSFDISQHVTEVLDSFVKQLLISRDFVERKENCRVSKLYVSGGAVACRDWMQEMKSGLGIETECWSPFDAVRMEQDAFPAGLKGQEGRFAAAVGAGLATLVEESG